MFSRFSLQTSMDTTVHSRNITNRSSSGLDSQFPSCSLYMLLNLDSIDNVISFCPLLLGQAFALELQISAVLVNQLLSYKTLYTCQLSSSTDSHWLCRKQVILASSRISLCISIFVYFCLSLFLLSHCVYVCLCVYKEKTNSYICNGCIA